MKELLTRTLAALALLTLIAAPAAAAGPESAVEIPAPTDALIEPAVTAEAPSETPAEAPLEVQVPADLPNKGHACVLPPPQQNEECICPLVFDPVCGCNDVTYSNSCFASCEVRTWDEGACE